MEQTPGEKTTAKATEIFNGSSKTKLALDLSMSRPTLYTRLRTHNWRQIEVQAINILYEQDKT